MLRTAVCPLPKLLLRDCAAAKGPRDGLRLPTALSAKGGHFTGPWSMLTLFAYGPIDHRSASSTLDSGLTSGGVNGLFDWPKQYVADR
jgi:hypothetical protein